MVFTSKALLTILALAPATFAIPGPSWFKRQDDAQSSLTLDPAVISPGLAQDGQGDNPDPGQVRSLTSKNNFINQCLTQDVPLTNGQQIVDGSCNPTPMGRIISFDVAPSSKFLFPKNTESSIQPNQAFTIQMKVNNMVLGNFVNAQSNYYAAPQQVNGEGKVIGHTHVVVEPIPSFDVTEPLEPLNFAFFKGVNGAADADGIVTVSVDKGLAAGFYRLCSINTAANHQPVLLSNAQHGALDDCVYFAIGQGDDPFKLKAGDNANSSTSTSASESAAATVTASESGSAAATTTTASESESGSGSGSATESSSSAPAATQSADAGQNDNKNGDNGANQDNNQNGGNGTNQDNNQQQGGNNNQQQGGNDANQNGDGNNKTDGGDNNGQQNNADNQQGTDNANNANNANTTNNADNTNNADVNTNAPVDNGGNNNDNKKQGGGNN
jgi:hypothetical protein